MWSIVPPVSVSSLSTRRRIPCNSTLLCLSVIMPRSFKEESEFQTVFEVLYGTQHVIFLSVPPYAPLIAARGTHLMPKQQIEEDIQPNMGATGIKVVARGNNTFVKLFLPMLQETRNIPLTQCKQLLMSGLFHSTIPCCLARARESEQCGAAVSLSICAITGDLKLNKEMTKEIGTRYVN